MAGIFYFLILRPQMRRQKEQQAKIAAIKKGDSMWSPAGGLIAKVIKVDDTTVDLELGPNVRVKAVQDPRWAMSFRRLAPLRPTTNLWRLTMRAPIQR